MPACGILAPHSEPALDKVTAGRIERRLARRDLRLHRARSLRQSAPSEPRGDIVGGFLQRGGRGPWRQVEHAVLDRAILPDENDQRARAVERDDAHLREPGFAARDHDHARRAGQVARGAVEVDASAPLGLNQTASALLRAGDQAVAPERVRLLAPARELELSQVAPEEAGAWRLGHLSYIEAPLADLVADLNRYYAPGIRLSDPELGAFRLTASFRVEDIDTFLSTLPDAAPVRLTRGPRDEVVISPAR